MKHEMLNLRRQTSIKEDLKETHKIYIIQVQTFINQKAIETLKAKKPLWKFW